MRGAWAMSMVCLVALCAPARALACKCAPPPAVADALREAAAVFEGRVTKLTPLNSFEVAVELSVTRSWKGADNEHILLRTPKDAAACGIQFAVDDAYLVYAQASPDEGRLPGLIALRCGRTQALHEADEDLAALGIGVVPVSGAEGDLPASSPPAARDKPAAGGCASCSARGVPGGGGLGALAAWLLVAALRFARSRRTHPRLR